jgi:hypothetical protein
VSEVVKAIFKVIGALMFVYAALSLVVLLPWVLVCIHCWPIFSAPIILGIGMFYLRKWAAVGFSLLCCFIAFSIFSDPFPLAAKPPDWPSFIAGFLFMIPAVLTVTQWRVFVWRTK